MSTVVIQAYDAGSVVIQAYDAGTIVETQSLFTPDWDARPTLQAGCIFHSPLNETSGTTAADVSGNGNHGIWVNSPTLAQPPMGSNALKSVLLGGTSYLAMPAGALVNYATTSMTAYVRFKTSTSGDVVFSASSSSTHYIAGQINGTNMLVRVYDGSVLKTITIAGAGDGNTHDLVIRWNQSTLTLSAWMDGTAYTPQVATGLAPAAPTKIEFGGNGNMSFTSTLDGPIELPRLYSVALSDALCLELSTFI